MEGASVFIEIHLADAGLVVEPFTHPTFMQIKLPGKPFARNRLSSSHCPKQPQSVAEYRNRAVESRAYGTAGLFDELSQAVFIDVALELTHVASNLFVNASIVDNDAAVYKQCGTRHPAYL